MRLTRITRIVATLVIAGLAAACGGGGGGGPSGSDPAATVKAMVDTLTAGNWDKIPDYACAAQKDKVTKQFDPSGFLGSSGDALGLKSDEIKQVFKISVSGLDLKEKSKDGAKAVVAMTGKMKMEINKDKFKEIMKKALTAAGQPADDATLNLAMGMVDSLGQEQDISTDIEMVNEGGKWLMCPS